MKKTSYVISEKALGDLEDIWSFTASKWSVDQADRYYNLIIDEIDYICKNITSGKSMAHVREGYRATKVKSHLIFYKIADDIVQIVRILHERMDVNNRISD